MGESPEVVTKSDSQTGKYFPLVDRYSSSFLAGRMHLKRTRRVRLCWANREGEGTHGRQGLDPAWLSCLLASDRGEALWVQMHATTPESSRKANLHVESRPACGAVPPLGLCRSGGAVKSWSWRRRFQQRLLTRGKASAPSLRFPGHTKDRYGPSEHGKENSE